MAKHLISFWVLLCFTFPIFSESQNLLFSGFKRDANGNMSLSGGAEIHKNGILQLTNDSLRVLGHAFYAYPVRFKNSSDGKMMSFSTSFVFAIQPRYVTLGGHGFAFTICPNKDLPGALPSQYLGLMNASDVGNLTNHVFAVEFDTVQDFEFGDINDNHVGVDLNSLVSNKSVSAGYFGENSAETRLDLKSGVKIQAWIDYDSGKKQLSVKLSPSSIKPTTPILTFDVDLGLIFEDFMYIGFSASTGLLSSSHYIMGWSFQMNGEAESFSLSSLPSTPVPATSNKSLVIGVSVSVVVVLILGIMVALYIIRKIRNADVIEAWELDVGPHRFPYQELKKATKGFRDKELLGFGGFGRVYKGTLPNTNTQIAVKRISHESKQGMQEFVSEISSIGRLRHRNLVQLLGWCRRKDDLMLVYDYMPNGSLDKYIFDKPQANLTWEQRFKIIKDVASGLLYLHEEWEQTVIHRDIKAGNVLLDAELNGRLGDFGLAKLYEHGSNPSTTRVVGTLGYLAPELTRTGKPTTSSDVFAFGALMLEVVCGRRPIEPKALPEELILVDWVWEQWKTGAILDVVDTRLVGEFDEVEVIVVLKSALMCSNDAPNMRPTIRQVVRYLEGEVLLPEEVAAPGINDEKKVSDGNSRKLEFEDYVNSYPTASYLEKVSTWSSNVDDADNDLEAGSSSPYSLSGRGDGSQT